MKRDLAQLVFFVAWFVVLYRFRPLRELVFRAPRLLTISVALLGVAWTVAQLADSRARYFPLISVHMYGEYTPAPVMASVGILGRRCDRDAPERLNLDFMGRVKPRLQLHALYRGLPRLQTAADSASSWAIINGALGTMGRFYNESHPAEPLCTIGLDELVVPAGQYDSGILPPRRVVHEIPLR